MNLLDIIKKFNSINNTIYIIDFDHTITTFDSNTSIGVYSLYLGQKTKRKKIKLIVCLHVSMEKQLLNYSGY